MTRLFYFLMALAIALLLLTLELAGRQLIVAGTPPQAVVEYRADENTIKLSNSVDFAWTKITFQDLPGHSITVKELRDIIKARMPVKTP